MDDQEYAYAKQKILELFSIDLENYKEKQMRRRLGTHIERNNASDAYSYFDYVLENSQMLQALKDFITINVSEFFRDERQFTQLENKVLPELLKRNRRLKIWSAGCSNGAEPYTLAIILADLTPGTAHSIIATDVDETILSRARNGGPYNPQDVKNVTAERLQKYFHRDGEKYWVVENIRKHVEFKRHNLLGDPYEKYFDLILCRNVVIYFTDSAKAKMNAQFSQSLKDGGILFVGGSETIFNPEKLGFVNLMPALFRKNGNHQ